MLRVLSVSRPTPWTPGENRAVCALYAAMRQCVDQGKRYQKAGMIRAAQHGVGPGDLNWADLLAPFAGELAHRSKGSIEAKLMNVTAALDKLKLYQFSMAEHGYRPLSNVQASLVEAVKDYFGRLAVRRVLS